MKNLTLKLAMAAFGMLTLAACPSKKGSDPVAAAPTPGPAVNGVCTVDVTGACVGGVSYVGFGSWKGTLTVAPGQLELYRQFLIEQRLCDLHARPRRSHRAQRPSCNHVQPYLAVQVRLKNSFGKVSIKAYNGYNFNSAQLNVSGLSYAQTAAPGFIFVSQGNLYQTQQYPNQPILPGDQASGMIQVAGTFDGGQQQVISVNTYYRGILMATGQLEAPRFGF